MTLVRSHRGAAGAVPVRRNSRGNIVLRRNVAQAVQGADVPCGLDQVAQSAKHLRNFIVSGEAAAIGVACLDETGVFFGTGTTFQAQSYRTGPSKKIAAKIRLNKSIEPDKLSSAALSFLAGVRSTRAMNRRRFC